MLKQRQFCCALQRLGFVANGGIIAAERGQQSNTNQLERIEYGKTAVELLTKSSPESKVTSNPNDAKTKSLPNPLEVLKKGIVDMFMGEVMKRTKGKADPKKANQLIIEKLKSL